MTSHGISNDRATVPQGGFLVRVQTIHLFLVATPPMPFKLGVSNMGKTNSLHVVSSFSYIRYIYIYICMYFFCDVGKPSCFL